MKQKKKVHQSEKYNGTGEAYWGQATLIGDSQHLLGTANTYWGQAIGNSPNVPSKRNKSGISVIHTKIIIGKQNDLVSTGDTRGCPQGFFKI